MEKRIKRWKRVTLGLVLYSLAITLAEVIDYLFLCIFHSYLEEIIMDLLMFLDPKMPILLGFSVFLEAHIGNLPLLLFWLVEPLLLLLGWWLASKGKRSGSRLLVACALTHLLLELLVVITAPLASVFLTVYFVYPILLLVGYTKWQPPLT